jgi:folate-binding protein YgfZ
MNRSTRWIAPVSPDLVWFSGPDAIRFLNDIISQEIAEMAVGQVRRSMLLGARGKLDHLLWVLRGDDVVGLVTDEGRGDQLAATLGRYRIRVEVSIEPEERPRWLVMGGEAPSGWTGDHSGSLQADLSWQAVSRTLVAGPPPDLPSGTKEEYERARISSGEPEWGVDVDETTIPQETGLAEQTVDFDKGCYLGQELVGRIHSRGHVNRHLRLLEAAETLGPGVILHGEVEVGVVTSVSGGLGMGLVRREVAPGEVVRVGGVAAVVRELPISSSSSG